MEERDELSEWQCEALWWDGSWMCWTISFNLFADTEVKLSEMEQEKYILWKWARRKKWMLGSCELKTQDFQHHRKYFDSWRSCNNKEYDTLEKVCRVQNANHDIKQFIIFWLPWWTATWNWRGEKELTTSFSPLIQLSDFFFASICINFSFVNSQKSYNKTSWRIFLCPEIRHLQK